jgi:hypothetical protein
MQEYADMQFMVKTAAGAGIEAAAVAGTYPHE